MLTILPSVTVIVAGPLGWPAASVMTEPAWMIVVSAMAGLDMRAAVATISPENTRIVFSLRDP